MITARANMLADAVRRRPTTSFSVLSAVAFLVLMVLGRHLWFFGDEWAFIVTRRRQWSDGHYTDYLFQPHNEHWSTVHVLVHAVLFKLFGLRSYMPYLAASLLAHLYVVGMVRLVLRRIGLTPWQANLAAALLLLLGSGAESLAYGFQFGFTIAVALGLTQLVLADHDGPIGRRDLLAVAFAIAGLASSNTAVPVVIATGVLLAIRGRWRAAALHTVVPGAVYLAWYAKYGVRAAGTYHPDQTPPYTYRGITSALEGLTQWKGAGAVVVIAILVTMAVIGREGVRATAAAWGCAVGAVAMYALTSVDRASLGIEQATSSRYAYVGAVLLLPCLTITVREVVKRLPAPAFFVVAMVAWATVGGLGVLLQFERERLELTDSKRKAMAAAIAVANEPGVDLTGVPDPEYAPVATVGVLAALVRSDDLPVPAVPTADLLAAQLAYLVYIAPGGTDQPGAVPVELLSGERAAIVATQDQCIDVVPSGGAPRLNLEVPAGSVVSVTSEVGGDGAVALSSQPGDPITAPRIVTFPAGSTTSIVFDVAASASLDLPGAGTTRVCPVSLTG